MGEKQDSALTSYFHHQLEQTHIHSEAVCSGERRCLCFCLLLKTYLLPLHTYWPHGLGKASGRIPEVVLHNHNRLST